MKIPKNPNMTPAQGVYERMALKEGSTYQPRKQAANLGLKMKSPWAMMKPKEKYP
jgi:hypothetical protein